MKSSSRSFKKNCTTGTYWLRSTLTAYHRKGYTFEQMLAEAKEILAGEGYSEDELRNDWSYWFGDD